MHFLFLLLLVWGGPMPQPERKDLQTPCRLQQNHKASKADFEAVMGEIAAGWNQNNAERAAACFSDRRETEATETPSDVPPQRLKTLVRASGDLAHGDFAPLPVPVQPHQWQGPVVSPDGNPRPPDDAEGRPLHARRRRIPPRATSVPATPL